MYRYLFGVPKPQGVPGETVREFTESSPREVDEDREIKEGLSGRETSMGSNFRLPYRKRENNMESPTRVKATGGSPL